MSEPSMHIRKLTADHLEQYNDLLRYAFQVTEKTLREYGWEDEDIRQSKFPVLTRANVLGWFDGGNLVSQFAVYPMDMNVHGAVYPIGFITSVATYPEYTGMGLMSRLMRESLTQMRAAGQSLALLYPYSIPLYRHRGWEIIADKMTYRIRDSQLPTAIQVPGHVRRVSEYSGDLTRLHARFAEGTHGCIFRNGLAWEEYWRWDVDDTTVALYYDSQGQPTGYMVYLIREDIMHIKEMIYLNREAEKGLWKYIGAHESMVGEVRGNNFYAEPLAFSFEDSDIKESIRPYIMGRIIDVGQFLARYRFACGEGGAAITFDVQDDFLPWNSGTFTVTVSDTGEAALADAPAAHRVSLDIGTLTTLLLGYKRAPYLARLERLHAVTPGTLRLLERILRDEKPYISDYI